MDARLVVLAGMGMLLMALAAGCATMAGGAGETPSDRPRGTGAFNLRILSDSTPDFSTRERFVRSVMSGWESNQERCQAMFRWMHRSRRVGSYAPEDERPVLDPVLFFNSYGVTYCSMISQMNCSMWEAAGLPGRLIDLPGHVVSEVLYDGAWHMYDNDFCQYYMNAKGQVASAAELGASRIHGNVEDLVEGEYYIFDHCTYSSSPRGRVYMGPSSWSIIGVAKDWYPSPNKIRVRKAFTGSHAGHRFVLGVRPGESYTRYWRPLGLGDDFARPFRNGKDPADDGTVLKNSRSNGIWGWTPDLSDASVYFASENVKLSAGGVAAADAGKPAFVVLRVPAANVVTSAKWWARLEGRPAFSVSGNGGAIWSTAINQHKEPMTYAHTATESVAGRLEYLLKIELGAGDRVSQLKLETITQVNPRALPALKLGANRIAAVSDGHFETTVLNPRLAGGRHASEVHSQSGWQSIDNPHDPDASIRGVKACELVLRAQTPRAIRGVRMAATTHMGEPGAELFLTVSGDGGEKWDEIAHEYYSGWPADHRFSFETDKLNGTRDALLRYAYDTGGSGLVNVVAEVQYEPAGGMMTYDVVFCWQEYRDGEWVERQHRQRVAGDFLDYTINVGGTRPPRMQWLRVEPAGDAAVGYSDGQDVGGSAGRPGYRLEKGVVVSVGAKYEVSRPAADAYPDVDGGVLTDRYVGIPSFWGMNDINLAGKKNEGRVGEMVAWGPGDEVVVTLDLGRSQRVGGAEICAVGPNKAIQLPASMTVETSEDGNQFQRVGTAEWADCFFPAADALLWEGRDAPIYDDLPAGGILTHEYAIPFSERVDARYVRIRMQPREGAGLALWELLVYDRLGRRPHEDHLRLPTKAGD